MGRTRINVLRWTLLKLTIVGKGGPSVNPRMVTTSTLAWVIRLPIGRVILFGRFAPYRCITMVPLLLLIRCGCSRCPSSRKLLRVTPTLTRKLLLSALVGKRVVTRRVVIGKLCIPLWSRTLFYWNGRYIIRKLRHRNRLRLQMIHCRSFLWKSGSPLFVARLWSLG